MKLSEVAKDMNCSQQFLRLWIKEGTCPFGKAIKNSSVYTYYINAERYQLYKEGKL